MEKAPGKDEEDVLSSNVYGTNEGVEDEDGIDEDGPSYG
jgi:hypothetical protein